MKRKQFLEIPEIQQWKKITGSNPDRFLKNCNKLLIICNTLKRKPTQLIDHNNHLIKLIEVYHDFKQRALDGEIKYSRRPRSSIKQSFNEYGHALKSFTASMGYHIPPRFEFEKTKEVPNYSEIDLTDAQMERGLEYFSRLEKPYLWAFALQSEIFCRISALLFWKNNLEVREEIIHGEKIEYGYISKFYEPKQTAYWNKRIFDKKILQIIKEIPRGQTIFPTEKNADYYSNYCDYLRKFYDSIGKIDDTRDGQYYSNFPTHALRHASTRKALRRTGGNYSIVASMGWSSDKIVRSIYSKPDEELVLNQNKCNFCNKESVSTNVRTCTFEHFLLLQRL